MTKGKREPRVIVASYPRSCSVSIDVRRVALRSQGSAYVDACDNTVEENALRVFSLDQMSLARMSLTYNLPLSVHARTYPSG